MNIHKTHAACLSIIAAIFLGACGQPDCKNENVVFERYPTASKEYTNELARQLRSNGGKNISFWFDHYEEQEGKEYIFVDAIGNKFCAKAKILVTDWNKLAGIRKTKGAGYNGAGLVGLTVDYLQDSTSSQLIYKNIDHISD